MAEEFPAIFGREHVADSWVVAVGGRPVSLIGVARYTMSIDGVVVPSASIGAVCTHPDYRGRGLAGRALDAAIDDTRRRGDVIMPISGGRSLYTRRHAAPAGPYHRMRVPRQRLGRAMGRPFEDGDVSAVMALHERRPVRYRWRAATFRLLQDVQLRFGSTAWVHADAAGRLDAWAIVRSGGPMHADPHSALLLDWAGRPDRVGPLAAAGMDSQGCASLEVGCAWHERELIDWAAPLAAEHEVSAGRGTLRLLHLPRLIELFAERLAPLHPRVTDRRLEMTTRAGTIALSDPTAIHHLLFSQASHWPEHLGLPGDLGAQVLPMLPIGVPDYGIHYT